MGSWRRWGAVLLVLAVAVPVAILGKGGEAGPVDERDTSCWPCHVGWAPPLKNFHDILPPPEAGAPVGEPFEYVVRLQGVWAPPGDGPYIKFVNPTLDLTNAPSLSFAGGPEPIPPTPLVGAMQISDNPPPLGPPPFATGYVSQLIPDGMTYVRVQLQPPPSAALGLNIYTGTTQPDGSIAATVPPGASGQPVEFLARTAEEVAALGTGNWTLEAFAADLVGYGVPPPGGQQFTVTVEARAETTGLRRLPLAFVTDVAKGSSYLFRFGLAASQEPGPDESVALVVNTTVYYKHKDRGTDDYANLTEAYPDPLPVRLNATDGRVTIIGPQDTTSGVPQPFNGWSLDTLSEAIGYGSAFLLVSSIWTGGMFGKASRRQLNAVFGSAKRRVAFHNFLSYGIILFAAVHTVLFIVETAYYWTLGVLWGGAAILAMAGLGVTGAWQVGMIRRWSYGVWRWSHYGLAVGAIVFTLVHMALDGVHFDFVQERLGWNDPLDPREGVQ